MLTFSTDRKIQGMNKFLVKLKSKYDKLHKEVTHLKSKQLHQAIASAAGQVAQAEKFKEGNTSQRGDQNQVKEKDESNVSTTKDEVRSEAIESGKAEVENNKKLDTVLNQIKDDSQKLMVSKEASNDEIESNKETTTQQVQVDGHPIAENKMNTVDKTISFNIDINRNSTVKNNKAITKPIKVQQRKLNEANKIYFSTVDKKVTDSNAMENLEEASNKVNQTYKILYNIEKDMAVKNSNLFKL